MTQSLRPTVSHRKNTENTLWLCQKPAALFSPLVRQTHAKTGFEETLRHTRGLLAQALGWHPHSGLLPGKCLSGLQPKLCKQLAGVFTESP